MQGAVAAALRVRCDEPGDESTLITDLLLEPLNR